MVSVTTDCHKFRKPQEKASRNEYIHVELDLCIKSVDILIPDNFQQNAINVYKV